MQRTEKVALYSTIWIDFISEMYTSYIISALQTFKVNQSVLFSIKVRLLPQAITYPLLKGSKRHIRLQLHVLQKGHIVCHGERVFSWDG